MAIRLLSPASPSPIEPFSWNSLPTSPVSPISTSPVPTSPQTTWLSARDMKTFGSHPLKFEPPTTIVRCRDCNKPILRSAAAEHAENCKKIKAGPKKGKTDSKKRKSDEMIEDGADDGSPKKKKPATKVTKGRFKGPVDVDKQCGVINDKGLPCSRSLTCKSHSMGAKRAVQGRSRDYDALLLDWNRANKPGFVEPVKKETKKEKKEKRDKEREEKKKLMGDKKGGGGAGGGTPGTSTKKSSKKAGQGANAGANAGMDEEDDDDDVDSEAEVDAMIRSIRKARDEGRIGIPMAVPDDAGSYFVMRRERLRCTRDLLLSAL
ncbi:SCA7-domain-containing protein, partial [Sistotremastrum niveocremeum HHB9708]